MRSEAIAESGSVARAIRTPRAAALAGIVFSVLFAVALVLVRMAVPADPDEPEERDPGEWHEAEPEQDRVPP